jgi:hypothetical protein
VLLHLLSGRHLVMIRQIFDPADLRSAMVNWEESLRTVGPSHDETVDPRSGVIGHQHVIEMSRAGTFADQARSAARGTRFLRAPRRASEGCATPTPRIRPMRRSSVTSPRS